MYERRSCGWEGREIGGRDSYVKNLELDTFLEAICDYYRWVVAPASDRNSQIEFIQSLQSNDRD
jgi:hypothetical protein